MSDSDLQITFGGDASGAKAASEEAAGSIKSIGPTLDAVSKSLDVFQKAVDVAFQKPDAKLPEVIEGWIGLAQAVMGAGTAIAAATAAMDGFAAASLTNPIGWIALAAGAAAVAIIALRAHMDEQSQSTKDLAAATAKLGDLTKNLNLQTDEQIHNSVTAESKMRDEALAHLNAAKAKLANALAQEALNRAQAHSDQSMRNSNRSGPDKDDPGIAAGIRAEIENYTKIAAAAQQAIDQSLAELKRRQTPTAPPPVATHVASQPQPSQMETWKTQFQDQENAHNDMLRNETRDEREFWKNVLATANVNGKEKVEIQRRVSDLTHQLSKTEIAEKLSDSREETAGRIRDVNTELAAEREALTQKLAAVDEELNRGVISATAAHDRKVQLINDEKQAEINAAREIYLARVDGNQAAMTLNDKSTEAYRKAAKDSDQAWNDLGASLIAIDARTNKTLEDQRKAELAKQKTDWDQSVGQIARTFGQGLLQMAQGTRTFGQVMMQALNQIANQWMNHVAKSVSDWMFGETKKTAVTTAASTQRQGVEEAASLKTRLTSLATTEKEIFNHALSAGAAAYKSMAGIPIIGPELGALAAATTFAAVEVYGNMASAAGGWGEVPADGMMTELHKQEMVLPARLANPLRDMLTGYDDGRAGASASAAGKGGDTHNHTWTVSALDARNLETYLRRNSDVLARVLTEKVRMGAAVPA